MPEKKPERRRFRNERIADLASTEMAERLMFNPLFEGMCIGDPEKGIEPVDRGIEIIREHGSVIENTKYSFGTSYRVECRESPFGMVYTLAIVRGQEESGKIKINYREYEILPQLRERAA